MIFTTRLCTVFCGLGAKAISIVPNCGVLASFLSIGFFTISVVAFVTTMPAGRGYLDFAIAV